MELRVADRKGSDVGSGGVSDQAVWIAQPTCKVKSIGRKGKLSFCKSRICSFG